MSSKRKKKSRGRNTSVKTSTSGAMGHDVPLAGLEESSKVETACGSKVFIRYVTYNFVKCDNIQVGDENTLICEAREMLEQSRAASNHHGGDRDKVIIGMINSILNPECSDRPARMNLQKLESAFNRLYGAIEDGKHKTFRIIAGVKLRQFVERHKDVFSLSMPDNQWVVEQNLSKRSRRERRSSSHSRQNKLFDAQTYEDDEESEYASARSGTPQLNSRESSPERHLSTEISQQEINEAEWSKVSYVRRKSKDFPGIFQTDSSQTLGEDELQTILQHEEGPDLLLQESEYLYFSNPMLLTLDIVSMWNTPNRSESYIVLGVARCDGLPHKIEGLLSSHSTYEFQQLFLGEYFNMLPSFFYRELIIQDKRVGVLTIGSSAGKGFPSVAIKGHEKEPKLEVEQLWYRRGKEKVICKPSDFTTGLIYQWFVGASSNHSRPKTADQPTDAGQTLHDQAEQNDSSTETETSASDITFSSSTDDLLKCVHSFQKGHFVLVAGHIPSSTRYLNALAKIPWLYVFDFDVYSREKGLLAACEEHIKRLRSFYIWYWSRHPAVVSEYATHWCFPRGMRDTPESRVEGSCREWFKITKHGIEKHCSQLAKFANDYTVLRVVVLWPDLNIDVQHLLKFLRRLDETMDISPKITLCFEKEPQSTTDRAIFEVMQNELQLSGIIKMPMEKLTTGIHSLVENDPLQTSTKCSIPCNSESSVAPINDRDRAWLREDLDVLYLENPFPRSKDVEAMQEEGDNFFKGGTLQWFTWYECGAGHFDVERDIKDSIVLKMKKLCNTTCKSVMITLFHAPGAGGTTLAQRILWELHTMMPCVQVKSRSGSTPEQLADRIMFLFETSHSPIIILVDGEDEARVQMLSKCLARISHVILYVKRFPYPMSQNSHGGSGNKFRYWLKGEVTADEANRLALKLRDRCTDERRKRNLGILSKNVKEGKGHCMYEFGLTAFLHEFRGVESYVRGYLRLDQNLGKELLNWQLLLGYLALAHYYGQTSIPCQFFANLLGQQPNYDVSIDDFSPVAKHLIVEETLEARSKCIRTSHYIIAQEILEQLLTRKREIPTSDKDKQRRQEGLSKFARQNLQSFAFEFIEYASKKRTKASPVSGTVVHIVTRSFIFREYRDAGEGTEEIQNRKRPILSRLISDIDSSPPFTERLRVLEKLTLSFPTDPNFQAHLGRFYAYCRPDDEEKAEECFKKALTLCEQHRDGKKFPDIDDKLNLTLMHIYHMYGMIYQRRITSLKKQIPPAVGTISPRLQDKLLEVLRLAEFACDLFMKCRQHTPGGQERCYGYVGEISARLEVCDLIQKVESHGVFGYISSPQSDSELVDFLKDSVPQIDNLVMECYGVIEADELDRSFFQVVLLFNTIFKKEAIRLDGLEFPEDSDSRRLKIAAKKLKFAKNDSCSIPVLEDIGTEADITQIVRMYEENFREVRESGNVGNKMALEMDYKEWLFAIRHSYFPETYQLEDVRVKVQHWYDDLRTPLSLFYLFVLTSLVGFGSKGSGTNTQSLLEAQSTLINDMRKMSKHVPRPRFPRDWLGKGKGIRQLVSGSRFPIGHIDYFKRYTKDPMKGLLAVCKGTICQPNSNRFWGYINLDLGDNTVSVKVFFVPKFCELIGSRFQGSRVEFILAFTLETGYEAYNVTLLKKVTCGHCQTVVEMKSDEISVNCPCGEAISSQQLDPFETESSPGADVRGATHMSE